MPIVTCVKVLIYILIKPRHGILRIFIQLNDVVYEGKVKLLN